MTAKDRKSFPFILCSIFSLMILMYYPLGLIRALVYGKKINFWAQQEGFTWEIIGYFAAAMLLLKTDKIIKWLKDHPLCAAGCGLYLIVLILQQIFIFPSFYYFGAGLSYLTLIGAGFFYAKEWRKLFLPLLWIFFLFSILMNIHDIAHNFHSGLTGNWNWSSTLTLISSGSLFFIFCKFIPDFQRKWGIYFTIFTILILFYLYFAGNFPKGTYLGALIGALTLLWGYLDYFTSRKNRIKYLLILVSICCIATALMHKSVGTYFKEDPRIYLWENGINVFTSNPLLGCEYGRYISEAANKMNIEYFASGKAASIHNHPHNEFIFLLANSGIIALTIIILMTTVWLKGLLNFERKRNFEQGYFLFIYTVLLTHAMVDIPLYHWPCNIIFYLLCGALLPIFNAETANEYESKKILPIIFAVIFCLTGGYLTYMNFMSSMYYRTALRYGHRTDHRLPLTNKSISFRPTYKNINDSAVLTSRYNAELGIKIMESMPSLTGIENYANNNLTLANLYSSLNQYHIALKYHEKEYKNFPLSIRNLYFFQQTLRKAGKINESNAINNMIKEIMKIQNIDNRHIPVIIKNPQYDLNPGRIPDNLLNSTRNNR